MVHKNVEVTARWEEFFDWGNTDPALVTQVQNRGRQIGTGLNLYVNAHAFKFQSNYFYNFGDDVGDGRHVVALALDASL